MYKDIEFKSGIIISIWECLSEIFKFRKFNWNTWTLIQIEFENDMWTGGYEFKFVLMCCGIRVRLPHETDKSKKFWEETEKQINKMDKQTKKHSKNKK